MSRIFTTIWLACGLWPVAACAQSNASEVIRSLAGRVQFLCADDFLRDRAGTVANVETTNYRLWRAEINNPALQTAELLPLLHDPDAKVRELAVAALYGEEDPKILPEIVKLGGDDAPGFSCPVPIAVASSTVLSRPEPLPIRQTTVGEIARAVVNAYLQASGYHYGIRGSPPQNPGFDTYWQERKDRSYAAGWFSVRMLRADTTRLAAIRKDIAALPSPDRQWTLLWVAMMNPDGRGEIRLASREELLEACRELGRKKLLLLLQGRIETSDPDLQPGLHQNYSFRRLQDFVLRNSRVLLHHDDAAEILRDETAEYDPHAPPAASSAWAIAAADLDHQNASRILHAAFSRFPGTSDGPDRAALAAALWRIAGEGEERFLIDWFYNEPPERCCVTAQGEFLRALAEGPRARLLVKGLVEDPRFDSLRWYELDQLVQTVNRWTPSPVVDDDLWREAWHPEGESRFELQRDQREHPRETQALLAVLAKWRQKLRSSVREWAN